MSPSAVGLNPWRTYASRATALNAAIGGFAAKFSMAASKEGKRLRRLRAPAGSGLPGRSPASGSSGGNTIGSKTKRALNRWGSLCAAISKLAPPIEWPMPMIGSLCSAYKCRAAASASRPYWSQVIVVGSTVSASPYPRWSRPTT